MLRTPGVSQDSSYIFSRWPREHHFEGERHKEIRPFLQISNSQLSGILGTADICSIEIGRPPHIVNETHLGMECGIDVLE